MARTHAIDRVLNTHGRGPWIASGVMVALGVIVVVWLLSPSERKRREVMEGVAIGADTAEVLRVLGAPVRCPPKATEQIRTSFPEDWPPRLVETALSRMDFGTRERWVYAISLRKR